MNSLRGRLLAFSALWTAVALVLAWMFIAALLRDFVTGRFGAELDAVAESVMGGAEWQGDVLAVTGAGDPRFDTPLSGWYWQIADGAEVVAKSDSLWTADLGPLGAAMGPDGAELSRKALGFTAPGDGARLTLTVTMPEAVVAREIARITRPLAAALAVLGAGLVAASVIGVTLGLRTLDHLRGSIEAVRAGRMDALAAPGTAELRPLAEEMNRLIEENRSVIARARAHVGNLAHALKTPLAALANGGADPDLIARMDRTLRWHLKRARTAGQGRSLGQTTPVDAVLDDLLQVLGRDMEHLTLTRDLPPLIFAGEREDLEEMLGNLLENAVKWAASRIEVTGRADGAVLHLTVRDDGPGIAQDDLAAALSRGARLDEAVPGSGLGLAIVADLVQVYQGRLDLSAGPGLTAVLTLPRARSR
ncbi:sensor histidine kinase [Cereibacter sp. SYSU M97828]|nr:sensor histidine kinase [Cereibacter flavus]